MILIDCEQTEHFRRRLLLHRSGTSRHHQSSDSRVALRATTTTALIGGVGRNQPLLWPLPLQTCWQAERERERERLRENLCNRVSMVACTKYIVPHTLRPSTRLFFCTIEIASKCMLYPGDNSMYVLRPRGHDETKARVYNLRNQSWADRPAWALAVTLPLAKPAKVAALLPVRHAYFPYFPHNVGWACSQPC